MWCNESGPLSMLFVNPVSDTKQAKDYFTRDLSRPDYYLKDASEMTGEWHGLGADLLGLYGKVDRDRYFQLCDNINPATGVALTPHTRGNRRILYDFTFDAPKSVSLAYELGGDERIMGAFRGAVKDTMSEMEGAMMARVRTQGRKDDRFTATWSGRSSFTAPPARWTAFRTRSFTATR
jgi:conjugative relaxase-like TrwC/TraI family protein